MLTRKITARQREVLRFLAAFLDKEQRAPTIREIGEHFGLPHVRGVTTHLDALERRGLIQRLPNKGSLKLLPPARAHVQTEKDRLYARVAELEAALQDISGMTLRLIQSGAYSTEASGCFCQIGRIATDALEGEPHAQ